MPRKTLQLQFPRLGVVRRYGLKPEGQQAEFGTPWAVNCRLEDEITGRLRGGSFTGIDAGAKSDPVYRDRAITFSSGRITAARQGDSTDTTLSADISDIARPVLFQLSEAGTTGGDVAAVVPSQDKYLLCYTASETWVLAGDPAMGALRRVSDEVGIIGADAWDFRHDTAYFLSSQGLYSVGVDGSGLQALSEDKIPEDLTGVVDSACKLTYNHATRGVFITLTSGMSWLYDTERQQFWPYDTDSTDSHVLIGPFRIGNPDNYGRILRLHGVTAAGSDDVNWRIVPGDTAEEAAANGKAAIVASLAGGDFSSYFQSSGTWTAGINHQAYPRDRAKWVVLWLSSEGTWAWEGASLTAALSGRWR